MKLKFILIFVVVFMFNALQADPCCVCIERYYNPNWANYDGVPYGYIDINDYPYGLPVNYCFNACPCRRACYSDYRYYVQCREHGEGCGCEDEGR